MASAASRSGVSGDVVTGDLVIRSRTFMGLSR
jgi:hypothetical protein